MLYTSTLYTIIFRAHDDAWRILLYNNNTISILYYIPKTVVLVVSGQKYNNIRIVEIVFTRIHYRTHYLYIYVGVCVCVIKTKCRIGTHII